ncbi:MAG: LacI family DNA-binding transcriptional regulator [Lentisphaeraceae bacterium]|nr:LacI family DNA-binding transcriptional regulator [Lentisphaeraceae bacterium]
MASLKDIADKTGYSIRTVNRALKNDPKIKETTKKVVLKAAEELNYVPNLAARALKSGGGFEVIAVINNLHELHLRKFAAMEKVLREHDLLLSIFIIEEASCVDELKKRLSLSRPAAAVLMADYDSNTEYESVRDLYEMFKSANIPCVGIDLDFEGMSKVILDRSQAIFDSIEYLYDQGRRSIAYAGIENAFGNTERIDGYRKAVNSLNIKEQVYQTPSLTPHEAGKVAMQHFIDEGTLPDAIQFFTDIMAVSALQVCQQNSINVPGDLSIIGFDNRPIGNYTQPPLTTINQPVEKVGLAAGETLVELIKSKSSMSYCKYINAKLVVRQST